MNLRVNSILPKIALVLAVFFWGSSFIAMKHAVQVVDPGSIIFLRMLMAALIFLLLFRFWGNINYQKNDWIYLSVMAICEPGIYFLLESQALRYTTAGAAATINSLQPPIVAFLAYIFLKEKLQIWSLIGFIFCIFGALGLSVGIKETSYAPLPWFGNLLEFGAMISSGVYIILLKKLSDRYTPLFLTALQSFIGVLIFMPFILSDAQIDLSMQNKATFPIIYLATFVTFGGYFLYNWGVSKTSAIHASIFLNLIPVFGVVLAFIFLDEIPNISQLIMTVIIIFGVMICEFGGIFARKYFR